MFDQFNRRSCKRKRGGLKAEKKGGGMHVRELRRRLGVLPSPRKNHQRDLKGCLSRNNIGRKIGCESISRIQMIGQSALFPDRQRGEWPDIEKRKAGRSTNF